MKKGLPEHHRVKDPYTARCHVCALRRKVAYEVVLGKLIYGLCRECSQQYLGKPRVKGSIPTISGGLPTLGKGHR